MHSRIPRSVYMAAGVLVLCGAWAAASGSQETAPGIAKSVLDGAYTEEQAKRGQEVFTQSCASCHGQSLEGMDMAPGLNGGAFLSNWNGLTVGDLFERVRLTMPQDDPGRLSRQQDADVVAYVLQVNKFPAGKTELPTQTEILKQIKFEAPKGQH
jgi:S-disulfanyl-L-cysteine oxidoreductase SoxD